MKYFFILIFPIIGMLGLIAQTEISLRRGETFFVEITGYDPRDYLKGHFLNFRFLWKLDLPKAIAFAKKNKNIYGQENYLCVIGKGKEYKSYPVEKETSGECNFLVRGTFSAQGQNHSYNRDLVDQFTEEEFFFRTGVEEFYIPEEHAALLEKLLREKKSMMEIRLNHQNRPLLKELYIDGRPWLDHLP